MLAALRPSHPPTLHRSPRRPLSKKPFSYLDTSFLKLRLKDHFYGWLGNRSPDMPKKLKTPSPKPPKSSTTRASQSLAVRQASGTQTNDSTHSRAPEHGGVRSESQAAARHRSNSPSSSSSPRSATSSAHGRPKPNLPASTYIDGYVEYRKALFIKIFMEKVDEWLDENVCTLEEAYDQEGDSQNAKSSGSRGIKRAASSGKLAPGQKRQHREEGRDDDQSGNEERNDRDRDRDRDQKRAKTDDDRQRFACPFFKYDPQRYKSHRSCCGPGWTEIHRLKEHLFRQHRVFTCSRCFDPFKTEKSLQDHMRAQNPCPLRDEGSRKSNPGAGISQDTEKQLRARKPGKQNKQSDVGRWYEVYHILFPGEVAAEDLPSPWYDGPDSSSGLSTSDDLKRQYEHFLRREIPSMIRRELEAEVERSMQDVGSAMQGRLATWIQNSAARCAQIFDYIPTPSQAATQPDPDTAGASRAGSPTVGAATGDSMVAWPFDYPQPEYFNFDLEFPEELFPLEQCQLVGDSAYGSGSFGSEGTWTR